MGVAAAGIHCCAYCVQAAQAGGRGRLLLLDEVDAALDESNQARAAVLLQQLCSGDHGCQVRATQAYTDWVDKHNLPGVRGLARCLC